MDVFFRTDASLVIGQGHVMRCLTLATALSVQGIRSTFVCREHQGNLCDFIEQKGFAVCRLPIGKTAVTSESTLLHESWLAASWAEDATQTVAAIATTGLVPTWLIVDHYALDARWELALKHVAKKTMVIDDLADRLHECDVLLDQNFYNDQNVRYASKVSRNCRLLLGPHYALLRKEFSELHDHTRTRAGPVKRILVFFGGVDAYNHTGRTLRTLIDLGLKDVDIDVVIGALHSERLHIAAVCNEHGFALHVQTTQMAELMAAADFSIGAGGSATWERCCLGLTTLGICTADNQAKQLTDAASEGLLFSFQAGEDLDVFLKKYVPVLLDNEYMRRTLSINAMHAVDGRGVLRVASVLGMNEIEMRMATPEDSSQLFEWRNHPAVRKVSRNTEVIPWERHQTWLTEVFSEISKVLLIGYREAVAVGVVRFDFHGDEAEVSIYLVPDTKSRGLGRELLRSAERWLINFRPAVHTLRAHVLGGNEPSHRLFSSADYQVASTCYVKRLH